MRNSHLDHVGANPYDRKLSDLVGELKLSYETMELSADDGLSVAIFTAEPGSASQQALDLLASWTATPSAAANAHR